MSMGYGRRLGGCVLEAVTGCIGRHGRGGWVLVPARPSKPAPRSVAKLAGREAEAMAQWGMMRGDIPLHAG